MDNFTTGSNYRDGYIQAVNDVRNWFERHSESMRFWRMYNKNGVMKVLASMCKNVDGMIVNGEEAELRIE